MMSLDFFKDATNAILVRPNEIGKPILVKNIAYHALINGHTLLFPTAGELLRSLATLGSDSALRRRLRYKSPRLLVIDEIGYPSYSNRHADLLFELVSRPMRKSSVVTTNRSFTGWRGVFPNAYHVSLVDPSSTMLEILVIDDESYRANEARERSEQRVRKRHLPDPLLVPTERGPSGPLSLCPSSAVAPWYLVPSGA